MKLLRYNGLSIALLALFCLSLAGMLVSGTHAFNEEAAAHNAAPLSLAEFALSGRFISALFENWESEFLQMATYVVLTAYLFQKGSAESRDPDNPQSEDTAPASWLYAHSLGVALAALFVLSFGLHFYGNYRDAVHDAALHGLKRPDLAAHVLDPTFWFESFQNWQSEFFSTAALVVLSIFLRYRGSPESKKVDDPDWEQTGR
jgi:membrane protein implicated in regulation of membrane protease activity